MHERRVRLWGLVAGSAGARGAPVSGHCPDAFRSGSPVLVADLGEADWRGRWPGFAVAGQLAGAAAVFAFPLVMGAIGVGVLLNSRAGRDGDGEDGQPTDGWSDDWSDNHAELYQASGVVSAQRGVGLEEALAVLRAYAFARDLTLDQVAAGAVADGSEDVTRWPVARPSRSGRS